MKKAIETTIDVEPINITPMSAEEARVAVEEIKGNLESLRRKLLELERREGWKALGYASWRSCAVAEFGHSVGYVYKLLTAAQVEENLAFSPIGETNDSPIGEIPVSQLVELGKLPPEQQLDGFRRAEELAASEGKRRTAAHVRASVQSVKRELSRQQKSAGLGIWNGKQVLPDCDRTTDAPPQPQTTRELTITVAGSSVRVVATPSTVEGMSIQYDFYGLVVSETGYRCHFLTPEKLAEYPSEEACLKALGEVFYEEMQKKSKPTPAKKDRSKLPPWLQAYLNLKDANPEAIVLVKVGDFYETYLDDAKTFASATEVILTSKSAGASGRVPMAGIPIEAIAKYTSIMEDKGLETVIDDGIDQQSNRNPNSAPAAVDAAVAALDQDDREKEETHIPECLADCTSLEEASVFVEQASIQQLSPEVRWLSSDPLTQAIALYKTLSPDQQREFCRVIGLEMPEAALAKC